LECWANIRQTKLITMVIVKEKLSFAFYKSATEVTNLIYSSAVPALLLAGSGGRLRLPPFSFAVLSTGACCATAGSSAVGLGWSPSCSFTPALALTLAVPFSTSLSLRASSGMPLPSNALSR
jgi:hypothetical protein